MAVVGGIDHLSAAISHATAPAFMLGAVAGFLSVLIGRMERIGERNRALQSGADGAIDPSLRDTIARSFARRMPWSNWPARSASTWRRCISIEGIRRRRSALVFAAGIGEYHRGVPPYAWRYFVSTNANR